MKKKKIVSATSLEEPASFITWWSRELSKRGQKEPAGFKSLVFFFTFWLFFFHFCKLRWAPPTGLCPARSKKSRWNPPLETGGRHRRIVVSSERLPQHFGGGQGRATHIVGGPYYCWGQNKEKAGTPRWCWMMRRVPCIYTSADETIELGRWLKLFILPSFLGCNTERFF